MSAPGQLASLSTITKIHLHQIAIHTGYKLTYKLCKDTSPPRFITKLTHLYADKYVLIPRRVSGLFKRGVTSYVIWGKSTKHPRLFVSSEALLHAWLLANNAIMAYYMMPEHT